MPRSVTARIEAGAPAALKPFLPALALLLLGNAQVTTPFDAAAAPPADTLALMAARRYGADGFHRVEALHYTFRVRFGGKDVKRAWSWYPRRDSVIYKGPDASGLEVSAAWSRRNRFSVESPGVQPLDKLFVNDQYWLLFPLHLVWDKGVRLESAPAPKAAGKGKGAGEAWRLTAVYPPGVGYTPGDAYDLYLDSAGTVMRWTYRKGNSPEPTRDAAWSSPKGFGPLQISLERTGSDGKFRLWFEDVRVEP